MSLKNAIKEVLKEQIQSLDIGMVDVSDDLNIYDVLDSFSLLNIVIETESKIEEVTGEYISLADESLMDASKSPFLKYSDWENFVLLKVN